MTATYIQVLRSGPVQPIGLPPTATAMGVSNARVLHRRMINNNSETINNNNTLLSAKRCLFGSPAPGEIQSLYKEEQKQNRERFIQRYNYDILNDRFVNEEDAPITTTATTTITTINNINNINNVDNEVDDTLTQQDTTTENCNTHETLEDRLHDHDQSDVDTTDASSGCSSSSNCDIKCNLDNVQLLAISSDNNNTKTTSTTEINQSLKDRKPNERLKPYSRQILMTGCSIIHWLNTDGKMFIPKLQKRLLQYPQSASIINGTNNHKNNNINNNISSTNSNTNSNNACNRSESITEAAESQASQSAQVPTL